MSSQSRRPNCGIFSSFDDLCYSIQMCQNVNCCKASYKLFHCPLCPVGKFKPTRRNRVVKHLAVHWKTKIEGHNGMYGLICHLPHFGTNGGHFHCTRCAIIRIRKSHMLIHTRQCGQDSMIPTKAIPAPTTFRRKAKPQKTEKEKISKNGEFGVTQSIVMNRKLCTVCGKTVSEKWFPTHIKMHTRVASISATRHHCATLVDPLQGIYTVSRNLTGSAYPIHVQKQLSVGSSANVFCESNQCMETRNTAVRSNHLHECVHLQSTSFANTSETVVIHEETLTQMLNYKLISDEKVDIIRKLKQSANGNNAPLVTEVVNGTYSSNRKRFMSVYTGQIRYFSRLRRTIVCYDLKSHRITCACSKSKRVCVHKSVAKCLLYQRYPDIFSSAEILSDDEQQDIPDEMTIEKDDTPPTIKRDQHIRYEREFKRIPTNIPVESKNKCKLDMPEILIPIETICCDTALDEPTVSTRSGKIIGIDTLRRDVVIFRKRCHVCSREYRFQDWSSGLHNFNDNLILTLPVCLLLRSNLENHVAIGRSILTIESMIGETLNHKDVMAAYLYFEVLSDHTYNFNCVLCGYYPRILVYDGFRKASFRHAVSELKPPEGEMSETVNADEFWHSVEDHICRHPFGRDDAVGLAVAYDNWSPWIGKNTRNSTMLHNTEFRKCTPTNNTEMNEPIPEEVLVNLLISEKVTSIRRICREAGVQPVGSSMDMILRLRQNSISRAQFDQYYEKIFGRTGGWAVGCCPHGVTYAMKCLLRSESPRDYIDIERSLKHRPNISMVDIAHLLAKHGNRTIENFFHPNEGRLAPVTPETVEAARLGKAEFTAPFLETMIKGDLPPDHHPISGSSDHYALYDWFHEGNCKDPNESLRKGSLLKELCGIIDTQVMEQQFSSHRRDIYFLNSMSPAVHLFVFRLMVHLKNEKVNRKNMKSHEKHLNRPLTFNQHGQLCVDEQRIAEEHLDPLTPVKDVSPLPSTVLKDNLLRQSTVEKPVETPAPSTTLSREHRLSDYYDILIERSKGDDNLKIIEPMVTDGLQSYEEMQSTERDSFWHNIRYAVDVLSRHASPQRQAQVRCIQNNDGVSMQYQGTTNYCGLCCLNNAFGLNDLTNPALTIGDMDRMADSLWIDLLIQVGLTCQIEAMRDREGYHSVEVLFGIVQQYGFNMIRMPQTLTESQNPESFTEELFQAFAEETETNIIVRESHRQHWTTIKVLRESYMLYDSQQKQPRVLTIEQGYAYIIGNCDENGAVFLLQRTPVEHVESLNEDPTSLSQDEMTNTTHEEDTHEEDDINGSPEESTTYNLREHKERKRSSSWVFPPGKRTYCVCNNPNDGRLYWQCYGCKSWFHPPCLGLDTDEEPDVFICQSCEGKPKKRRVTKKVRKDVEEQVQGLTMDKTMILNEQTPSFTRDDIEMKQIIPFITDDEMSDDVETAKIVCVPYILEMINVINDYVYGLLTDKDAPNRTDDTDAFMGDPSTEYLKGYGLGYLSDAANLYIEVYLKKKFFGLKVRDNSRPATSGYLYKLLLIPGSERLQASLDVEGCEVAVRHRRCHLALVRDTMALVVSTKLQVTMEEARARCKETEDKSIVRAMLKALTIRRENKSSP